MASAEIPPDPLADAVEAQPIAHSRLGWLASQLVALAIRGGTTQVIERLGLRWPDGSVSAPDLIVLPLGSVGWHTTSYAPGTDGPLPEVAVEIVSEAPSFDQIFERGVLTYLLVLDEPRVLRVDPGTLAATEVPDGEPVVELGGIAFQRGQERIGLLTNGAKPGGTPSNTSVRQRCRPNR